MNKQQSKKTNKIKTKPKKGKSAKTKNNQPEPALRVKKEVNKPIKICTNINFEEEIRKKITNISLTPKEAKLAAEEIQYPINKNKLNAAMSSHSIINRDQQLDTLLKTVFEEKVGKKPESKSSLPIFGKRDEILNLIENNSVIVVHGEPRSGKTTQIPQFILDQFMESGNGSLCKIVSTQPDVKNVLTAFDKVSKERRATFGNVVGVNHQIRFDSFNSKEAGSITYCTSGSLLRKLSHTNWLYLNQISHLILDEIQDRDVFTDILLACMKQIITKRTDFKLILICSSLYAKKISKYFNECEKINVSADIYPVSEYYLEDILIMTDFTNLYSSEDFEEDKQKYERKYPIAVTKFVKNYEKSDNTNILLIISVIKCIYNKFKDGNILIFLPTISDVHLLKEKIEKDYIIIKKTQIITLIHFDTDSKNSRDIKINCGRKIFITTNDKFVQNLNNILFVIDSGKIQTKSYDVITNMESIQNDWIGQTTAKQRSNLAGQKQSGFCFHLFSQKTKLGFDKYPTPEIMDFDLQIIILAIKGFGVENAEMFLKTFLKCPDLFDTCKAIEILKNNQILTNDEFLTPLGINVAKLFQKFAVGKMVILGALFSCLEPILTIAAYFNFRSLFIGKDADVRSKRQQFQNYKYPDSDTLLILKLFEEFKKHFNDNEKDFCSNNSIQPKLKDMENIMQELANILFRMKLIPSNIYSNVECNKNSKNAKLIKALLSVALYPNIAVIRNYTGSYLKSFTIETLKQRNVSIHPSSINKGRVNIHTPLLMYRTLQQSKDAVLQETTLLTPMQVLFFANDVKYSREKNYSVITVADSLRIYCTNNTSSIIKTVQDKFNYWLEYKLKYPAPVNWNESSWDTQILRAVTHLFDNETTSINEASIVGQI